MTNDTLTSIPTARSWAATAVLIPAIATQSGSAADVQVTPQMTVFGVRDRAMNHRWSARRRRSITGVPVLVVIAWTAG